MNFVKTSKITISDVCKNNTLNYSYNLTKNFQENNNIFIPISNYAQSQIFLDKQKNYIKISRVNEKINSTIVYSILNVLNLCMKKVGQKIAIESAETTPKIMPTIKLKTPENAEKLTKLENSSDKPTIDQTNIVSEKAKNTNMSKNIVLKPVQEKPNDLYETPRSCSDFFEAIKEKANTNTNNPLDVIYSPPQNLGIKVTKQKNPRLLEEYNESLSKAKETEFIPKNSINEYTEPKLKKNLFDTITNENFEFPFEKIDNIKLTSWTSPKPENITPELNQMICQRFAVFFQIINTAENDADLGRKLILFLVSQDEKINWHIIEFITNYNNYKSLNLKYTEKIHEFMLKTFLVDSQTITFNFSRFPKFYLTYSNFAEFYGLTQLIKTFKKIDPNCVAEFQPINVPNYAQINPDGLLKVFDSLLGIDKKMAFKLYMSTMLIGVNNTLGNIRLYFHGGLSMDLFCQKKVQQLGTLAESYPDNTEIQQCIDNLIKIYQTKPENMFELLNLENITLRNILIKLGVSYRTEYFFEFLEYLANYDLKNLAEDYKNLEKYFNENTYESKNNFVVTLASIFEYFLEKNPQINRENFDVAKKILDAINEHIKNNNDI